MELFTVQKYQQISFLFSSALLISLIKVGFVILFIRQIDMNIPMSLDSDEFDIHTFRGHLPTVPVRVGFSRGVCMYSYMYIIVIDLTYPNRVISDLFFAVTDNRFYKIRGFFFCNNKTNLIQSFRNNAQINKKEGQLLRPIT